RQAFDDRKDVPQFERNAPGGGSTYIVEGSLSQVVDLSAGLDGDDALENPLDRHLAGEEHDTTSQAGGANCERQRQCRFPAGGVPTEHCEVAATESAAEQCVQAGEARRHCLARRRAIAGCVDLGKENGEWRDVGSTGHERSSAAAS